MEKLFKIKNKSKNNKYIGYLINLLLDSLNSNTYNITYSDENYNCYVDNLFEDFIIEPSKKQTKNILNNLINQTIDKENNYYISKNILEHIINKENNEYYQFNYIIERLENNFHKYEISMEITDTKNVLNNIKTLYTKDSFKIQNQYITSKSESFIKIFEDFDNRRIQVISKNNYLQIRYIEDKFNYWNDSEALPRLSKTFRNLILDLIKKLNIDISSFFPQTREYRTSRYRERYGYEVAVLTPEGLEVTMVKDSHKATSDPVSLIHWYSLIQVYENNVYCCSEHLDDDRETYKNTQSVYEESKNKELKKKIMECSVYDYKNDYKTEESLTLAYEHQRGNLYMINDEKLIYISYSKGYNSSINDVPVENINFHAVDRERELHTVINKLKEKYKNSGDDFNYVYPELDNLKIKGLKGIEIAPQVCHHVSSNSSRKTMNKFIEECLLNYLFVTEKIDTEHVSKLKKLGYDLDDYLASNEPCTLIELAKRFFELEKYVIKIDESKFRFETITNPFLVFKNVDIDELKKLYKDDYKLEDVKLMKCISLYVSHLNTELKNASISDSFSILLKLVVNYNGSLLKKYEKVIKEVYFQ